MLVRLEGFRHFVQAVFPAETSALPQLVHDAVRQPAEQFPVIFRQSVQDPVHALMDEGRLVQFDLVGCELADFPGEGLEGLLEKLVDRADGEGAVIVQHVRQQARGPFPEPVRRTEFFRKLLEIRGFLGLMSQDVQFLEDPAFHLVGRLVRKRDGQDVPVGIPVVRTEQQGDVCFRQVVGLTRTGGGFQDPDHLPQMILKSQYPQVFRSSVRRIGSAGSAISASRSDRRSRTRRQKVGFISALRMPSVNNLAAG